MSRYSDINQLLDEIGTSDRSAGDPWTVSRSNQGTVKKNAFSPAVVADLGAPAQDLTSDIRSSEKIAKADEVVTSPTGSSPNGSGTSSTGSSILGGFLNLFPLASVVGKLFGFGGSSSPPPLTPYIQPPSVSFEGAKSGSLSTSTTNSLPGMGARTGSSSGSRSESSPDLAPGIGSISYGAYGLPRSSEEMSYHASAPTWIGSASAGQPDGSSHSLNVTTQLSRLTSANFVSSPAGNNPAASAAADHDSQSILGQLSGLTSSNFTSEPAASSPLPSADLMATTTLQSPTPNVSTSSLGSSGMSLPGSNASTWNSQQGQSILVQVQAMDCQSFMDHSNDIAQAVRQAMLNLHSVNDVIADL